MNHSLVWNYQALLDEGIRLIESFSSRNWTDYNVHDPGITTLEFLCYALTDLAGRVGLPMESLLAEKDGERVRLRLDFPQAHEVLHCGPVTVSDYRRLLLDIPGVRNVWLRPVQGGHPPIYTLAKQDRLSFAGDSGQRLEVRGCYEVEVEFDKTVVEAHKGELNKQIRRTLMANRNLCEDFNRIGEIGLEEVAVCLDVELSPESSVDEVKAEILWVLDEFIAPTIRRYTLQEMLDRGRTVEEVMNGPQVAHGFIDERDLLESRNQKELHGSDLVRRLMAIPKILAVRRLLFTTYQDGRVAAQDEATIVALAADRAPRFNPQDSSFRFFKRGIPYVTTPARVEKYLAGVRARCRQAPIAPADLRPPLPEPAYVEFGSYRSIQHHYPRNYQIGPEGLPLSAAASRRAAAHQFKAYLLLFEQLLADFNDQIRHATKLLSPLTVERTYAYASLADEPLFTGLLRDPAPIAQYYEDEESCQRRRNSFLDHLLARFGEQYREYSVLLENIYHQDALPSLIRDKERLLANFARLSAGRFRACDRSGQDDPGAISGLELRLRTLLGYTGDLDLSTLQESHFEIYQEQDTDGRPLLRFRIKDDRGTILLSSTRGMVTREEVRQEMLTALAAGTDPANYVLNEAQDHTWHFTLHDGRGDMIGRRIHYYPDRGQCAAQRDQCAAFLQSLFPEGEIFVVEHMLLRPYHFEPATDREAYLPENDRRYLLPTCFADDDADCCAGDAYSFRITVIMPAWPARFQDINFRSYLTRFIREQTPAHIFAKVCWISRQQMDDFQPLYQAWKNALAIRQDLPNPSVYLDALEQLIGCWSRLRSVYPPVYLYDCTDVKDLTPTVLGDSALGELNGADDDQD